MNFKKIVPLSIILAGLVAIPTAYAGAYVGLSMGEASLKEKNENDDLGDSNTFALSAGYNINDNFAIEAGYHNFDTVDYETGYYGDKYSLSADGVSVALVGSAAVSDSVVLNIAVGNLYCDAIDSTRYSDGDYGSQTLSGSNLFTRVGATFSISETMGLTLDYTQFEFDVYNADVDGDTISLGLRVDF